MPLPMFAVARLVACGMRRKGDGGCNASAAIGVCNGAAFSFFSAALTTLIELRRRSVGGGAPPSAEGWRSWRLGVNAGDGDQRVPTSALYALFLAAHICY